MATPDKAQTPVVKETEITAQVLGKIQTFMQAGELKLPNDYSPENALKGAMLILQETKDKSGNSVLQTCSKNSIAHCLLKMCVEGLSPLKKQGYFIAYGTELQWSRSYQGSMALAKRVGNVADVVANVIYEKDDFEYSIDVETGYKKIVKHVQKIENIDNATIKGAYAVVIYKDGRKDLEVMTIEEIKKAWMQGYAKGNSGAHNNFTQEMCKKTVINRACKNPINSSNDFNLYGNENEDEEITPLQQVQQQVEKESASELVDFVEVKAEPTKSEYLPPKNPTEGKPTEPEANEQKNEIKSFSEKLAEGSTNPNPEIKF